MTPKSLNLSYIPTKVGNGILISVFVVILFSQNVFSQGNCSGEAILKESACGGDEISDQEQEIARLVNEYRKQSNLTEVPISESLSLVANRHVLDLGKNFGYITHSWSDCSYKAEDQKTWNCIFEAPKKFIPSFNGIGFENVYYTTMNTVAPFAALEAWKRSPLHNSTMLNLDNFKEFKWATMGVAIDGKFAAIWFASNKSGARPKTNSQEIKGLGITFEQAVKGLTSVISIDNVSSSITSEKWVGTSRDKSVVLEMFGKTKEIAEGKMALRLRIGKRKTLSQANRRILNTFVRNLVPNWTERSTWIAASLKKLRKRSSIPQKIYVENIEIELKTDSKGFISLTIKPQSKLMPFEVK